MQVLNQNITQEKNPTASQQKAEAPVPGMKDGGNTNGIKKAATSGIQGDGISKDKTSKYLKVLSRIEGFLAKDALPEVAVKGFVGAVKKQLNQLTESEKQSLLKLPEARKHWWCLAVHAMGALRGCCKGPGLLMVLRPPESGR